MGAMTDLLSRPILRVTSPEEAPRRPIVLVAALGSAAVAVSGLLLFMAVAIAGWFAADSATVGSAMRVGALGWLVGNGSGVTGGGLSVHAVPLGFTLVFGYALYRVGAWASATCRASTLRYVALAGIAMAGVYAAVCVVTALVARVDGVHAPLGRTLAASLIVAAVSGGAGLLRGSGTGADLFRRLPEEARAAVVGGIGGLLVMLAVGAVTVAASLAAHLSTAHRLADGTGSGVVGTVILALVGAALVPNAVLCAGAFVAGPGFAVGSGTQVSPSGVRLGLLPDFPLLAALPTTADAWWLPALVVVPVLAGAAAGLLALRRHPVAAIGSAVLRGALAGLVGGATFGLLTVLATGSVGAGRLRHIGPDVLATTAVCAVAFVLGGVLAAASRWTLSGVGRRIRFRVPGRQDGTAPGGEAGTSPAVSEDEVTQPIQLP